MALSQMELLYGLPVFDPWQTFTRILYTSDPQVASSTKIVVTSEYGGKIVFTGSFTVTGGVVTGGTMTGFKVFANDTKVLVGSNYSTDAVALSAAIAEWQSFNAEPLYDLISEIPLKIVGSDDDDRIEGNDVSFKLIGRDGNDILEGGSGTGILKGGKGNDLARFRRRAGNHVRRPGRGRLPVRAVGSLPADRRRQDQGLRRRRGPDRTVARSHGGPAPGLPPPRAVPQGNLGDGRRADHHLRQADGTAVLRRRRDRHRGPVPVRQGEGRHQADRRQLHRPGTVAA